MENVLPTEITLDIFSRLPTESVLQCRQVCKTWHTLLHHPDFPYMHLRCRLLQIDDHNYHNHFIAAPTVKVGLLLLIELEDKRNHNFYQLCYQEFDENDERSYKPLARINHPLVNPNYLEFGSCNGLIYFSLDCPKYEDPVYICNPITREYVILPRFNIPNVIIEGRPKGCIVYGFGYLPSTNEYKVVRIYFHNNHYDDPSRRFEYNEVYAQVYTLGSGCGWRNIKYSSLLPRKDLQHWGALANGALHWMGDEGKIVYFDLVDEEFLLLPSLPYEEEYEYYQLHAFGGQLCVVHRKVDESIDIWSFKKNKTSSRTTNKIKEQEYQSWSWSREFNTVLRLDADDCAPFALTKSGEVLVWYYQSFDQVILFRYDPKTATLKELDRDFVFERAIPHVISFVSLKALGEDAKIIGPAEELLDLVKLQPDWY